MQTHDTSPARASRPLPCAHPARPSGPVVGRFRSLTLDWTDPDSGRRLRGEIEAPDEFLAQLYPQGLRVGGAAPLAGGACGRGGFRVRVSPGWRLPGRRNGL